MAKAPLVILAGGLGTRLREETEFRPKPMVEIGGMPIIWHIMKYYSCYGVQDFIVCTGYKSEMIESYFLDYKVSRIQSSSDNQYGSKSTDKEINPEKWNITIVDTGPLTPTGGRIYKIQKYINTDYFYCTYGDGVANIDIKKLTDLHLNSDAVATLSAVKPLSRFGVLDIDSDFKVLKFREKPRMNTWINGGYFVFNKKIFEILDDDTTLENKPLISLTNSKKLAAYKHEGFWQPMDTYRETLFLNELWDKDQAEWKIW
jgi:glucose-1-phosphate cytidylyltransferase